MKDQAIYEITGDAWFAEIEAFAKTKPESVPATGIRNSGGNHFATAIITPESTRDGVRKAYLVDFYYSSKGRPLDQPAVLDSFILTERAWEETNMRDRSVGTYKTPAMFDKLVAEILRQSRAIRKPDREREADGRWNVERTRHWEPDFTVNEPLYREVEALISRAKASAPGKPGDAEPWASIALYPRMEPPAKRRAGGNKIYRAAIYRNGRMKIFEVTDTSAEISSRDLGWFDAPELWNKLRLTIVNRSELVRESMPKK